MIYTNLFFIAFSSFVAGVCLDNKTLVAINLLAASVNILVVAAHIVP